MSDIVDVLDPLDLTGRKAKKAVGEAADVQREKIGEAITGLESQQEISDRLLRGGLASAKRTLRGGEEESREALLRGQQQFGAQLSPFAEAGRGALEQQQALLGLGTPEQQQQAFSAFRESLGQQFRRERQEKSLLRNAAAIGGLGGGNVRTALQQQAAGFAAQDFGNQFDRLGQLRSAGQQAATGIGQAALGTASGIGAGVLGTAGRVGQATLGTAGQRAQFGGQTAANIGNLLTQQGQARASGILGTQQVRSDRTGNILELGSAFMGGV